MEVDLKALGREGTHTKKKDFWKFADYVRLWSNYNTEILANACRPACRARSEGTCGQTLHWESEMPFGFRHCIGDILTPDEIS
jgi:hypothetical protein